MPTDIATLGIEEQTAVVNGPAAGDPRTAASVTGMGQPLVNRSLWAWKRIQDIIGSFAPLATNAPMPILSVDLAADTITLVGHGLSNGDPIRFLILTGGGLPAPLDVITLYYAVSVTADTFKVSLTSGGAGINLTGPLLGTVYVVAVSHPAIWLPNLGSFIGGALSDVLQQFAVVGGTNNWQGSNTFFPGFIVQFSGTTYIEGALNILGDNARVTWRQFKPVTDTNSTLDVWYDTYSCATPTAGRDHTIRHSTSPIPLPGQRITVRRPNTGNFAIVLHREGSAAAIVTLGALTSCSADLEYYLGAWRLRSYTPGATPGAEAD